MGATVLRPVLFQGGRMPRFLAPLVITDPGPDKPNLLRALHGYEGQPVARLLLPASLKGLFIFSGRTLPARQKCVTRADPS